MKFKRKFIRTLWVALPPVARKDMVNDFLEWLYADLLPSERRKKVERHAPRLGEWISKGDIDLSLMVYQHLKRMPWVSSLIRWAGEPKVLAE